MNASGMSRRSMLTKTGALIATMAGIGSVPLLSKPRRAGDPTFSYCLNTSTIRNGEPDIERDLEIAAKAGYNGIEIWVRDLEQYLGKGGETRLLRKKAEDLGLNIENAIAFSKWIVDDPLQRNTALEQAKKEMGLLAEIGCKRLAAPPVGATKEPKLSLDAVAARYKALLDIGNQAGVVPQLELWGFSTNLHKISQAMYVASECGHPDACVLLDVYHLYKGGSDINGLRMLAGKGMHMFHMNDYPATPPRAEIKDSDRVYPGDGIAPLDAIVRMLHEKKTPPILSLELFNGEYWQQDPQIVAETGLRKMKAAVTRALG